MMTTQLQQAFKIRLLLAVVCVCLVGFTPSTHAQYKKAERGTRGPISKHEMNPYIKYKRLVEG